MSSPLRTSSRDRLRYWEPVRLAARARQLGISALPEVPRRAYRRARAYALAPVKKRTFGTGSFELGGESHRYWVHSYTSTWENERAVEIPLALEFLGQYRDVEVLEIGNVTRHFTRPERHTVVDKYDDRPGVLSVDIEGFEPARRFDALLSVSTLEHVGWDETPRDPLKVERVLGALHRLVRDPAAVLVTVPLGYHPHLDGLVRDGGMPFATEQFLVRSTRDRWIETDRAEALARRYGQPFKLANAVYIGRGLREGGPTR